MTYTTLPQVFTPLAKLHPWPQVYKLKHLGMQTAAVKEWITLRRSVNSSMVP